MTWDNKTSRERLENERGTLKVNVSYALTRDRTIGPFFFDEDVRKTKLFCSSTTTRIIFFNWTVYPFIFFTLSVTVRT
jgi:hypothetical protein